MDPSTSLQLIIDYKTEGNALHAAVIDALAEYRSLDLLTHVDMTNASSPTLNVRPLTVVCSGNCPLASVNAQTPIRDVFLDAPLVDIANSSYTRWNSMLASTSYRKMAGWGNSFDVDGEMAAEIKTLVQISRNKGIPSRFWETPGCVVRPFCSPSSLRLTNPSSTTRQLAWVCARQGLGGHARSRRRLDQRRQPQGGQRGIEILLGGGSLASLKMRNHAPLSCIHHLICPSSHVVLSTSAHTISASSPASTVVPLP